MKEKMETETKEFNVDEAERREQILSDFKDKRSRYQDYWQPIYKEVESHRTFTLLGKQFQAGEAKRYGIRNPLEPNLLLTYANHEANKTLQTDYRGKVTPNGGGANEIKARERQDVLRGLQRKNDIKQVFNKVRRDQVAGGIAYSWAKMDYAGKRGFGKTLTDEFIENYQNVFPDINVKNATFSDMRDCLIKQDVGKSEWEELTGEKPEGWGTDKKKCLWHYWVREDKRDTEYLMEVGETKMGSLLPKDGDEPILDGVQMGADGQPLARPTADYTWCWYKITDDCRLIDEEIWLGSYSPIIACTGRKVISNQDEGKNKIYYQPLTQFAEEPQKIYTIIENIIGLRLGKSPFSKWKVAFESINIKDMIKLRENAMLGDTDILYRGLSEDGKTAIPPPEEIEPHVLDAILISLQQEQERKIQKIFGIFDANLGNRSNEQSGVAIRERAQGGELSNYDLQFNYMEYVEQVTRVKLDLIPKYLTAPQQLAFVDEEDKTVVKWVNTTGGVQFSPDEEYSLSVEAMPISNTAREDEADMLMQMAKAMPQIVQNQQVAALIIKAQPGMYTSQIAALIAEGDPQIQEAQKTIQELQGKLQQVTVQAQAKDMQATQTIGALKNTLTMLKQQMALERQAHEVAGHSAEAKRAYDDMSKSVDNQLSSLELQVKQYTAESGRMTAEANLLKVAGSLVEPPTPAPGTGLP